MPHLEHRVEQLVNRSPNLAAAMVDLQNGCRKGEGREEPLGSRLKQGKSFLDRPPAEQGSNAHAMSDRRSLPTW